MQRVTACLELFVACDNSTLMHDERCLRIIHVVMQLSPLTVNGFVKLIDDLIIAVLKRQFKEAALSLYGERSLRRVLS